MTSISSTYTASSSYILSLDTNGDGQVSADELAAAKDKGGRKQDPTVEIDGPTDAQSQLSGMLFEAMGGASAGAMGAPSFADMFVSMDSDDDGSVTEEEFVAARPDDVTEDMATALFGQIDSEGAGTITQDQFVAMMQAQPRMGPPPPPQKDGSEDGLSIADLFDQMDTDGDGTVSAAEFIAARPDDLTEEMASALFSEIDSESTGSVTQEQFAAAMARPPAEAASDDADSVSLADVLARINALFDEYLADAEDDTSAASIII